MAEQDPVISMTQSEFDAKIQEAVAAALRSMNMGKNQEEKALAVVDEDETPKGKKVEGNEALRAQVDKLNEFMMRHVKEGKDTSLTDISAAPKLNLPPKFKMPELVRFDGTGDPRAHVRHYIGVMRISGLGEEEINQLFPLSLTGAALTWYYTLTDLEIGQWSVMVEKFMQQYAYNTDMEVTRRELEETIQEEKETFSAFVKRWREKASKMLNRPSNEEQNKILLNCLNSRYYNAMFMIPVSKPFDKFYKRGLQIEDGLKSGKLIIQAPPPTWKRNDQGGLFLRGSSSGGKSSEVSLPKTKEVNVLNRRSERKFTPLQDPMSKILDRLIK